MPPRGLTVERLSDHAPSDVTRPSPPAPAPRGRICVFCGSSAGIDPRHADAVRVLGHAIAARGIALVYGGGATGLMGLVADAALAAGGHVIGVIPEALVARELAHGGLPDLRIVSSMHERKALMADLADAFVAAPGGFGTFEELCEAITWTQLGLHRKRCGLLNVAGFYDPLLALVDRAVGDGFVREDSRHILVSDTDPVRLLGRLTPVDGGEPPWLRESGQT